MAIRDASGAAGMMCWLRWTGAETTLPSGGKRNFAPLAGMT
ncbi:MULTISPECIES: hypothetical protein [Paenibacillus]|nr:hypothetical protein [Paenibacillus borealis]